MEPIRIPVLCARCEATGQSGEGDFAHLGDLLDFEPVPRRRRVDGWDGDIQRAFVAALAMTGSPRRACQAVGRAQYGFDQLRKAAGNESFLAACDKALAMWELKHQRRLVAGVQAAALDEAQWQPAPPPWSKSAERKRAGANAAPPADEPEPPREDDSAHEEFIGTILRKYWIKLRQERDARLSGRIAEADYYIRQVTCLEVALDVVGGDGMEIFTAARMGQYNLFIIAETPMSKLLDALRREHWDQVGDPPRPQRPSHVLEDLGAFTIEPLECFRGSPEEHKAQKRSYEERYAADAAAQIAWEAAAREDWARRRADGRIGDEDLPPPEEDWADSIARILAEEDAAEDAERSAAGASAPPKQREEPDEAGRPAATPTGPTSRHLLP
jgi:hypothetical protein